VYYNPEKLKARKLESLEDADIKTAFANQQIRVFDNAQKLESFLLEQSWKNKNLLLMSSGNFGGMDITRLSEKLLS
jgi:UDP-N-acetylmuramate: L-alanyl-gamma-D-glutamyl-meso-diaminopimelate ligase